VKFRCYAFVVALLLTATPVLGMVCRMDCDQPAATSACHKSAASPEGSAIRDAGHPCGHDHASGKPAVITSSIARDSAVTIVALASTSLGQSSSDTRLPAASMHGPPGPGGRSTASRITVLRI